MNKNFLLNEEVVFYYPQDATGQTVYNPGEWVIKYIGKEKEVVVPEGIKAIGDNAFSDCEVIVRVLLPKSLVWIGERAFSKCPNLKEVTIKDGLEKTTFGIIFADLPSLEKVNLPNTLGCLSDRMFTNCPMLRTSNIPDKLNYIYPNPFDHTSIKTLYLGAQVIPRGINFRRTSELTEFFVSEENEKIIVRDNIVYSKNGKQLLVARKNIEGCFCVPEGVETIDSFAFAHCGRMTEIVFPSSLYEIGEYAFLGCSELVRIHIPGNVKRIGDGAFSRQKSTSSSMYSEILELKPFEKISIDVDAGTSIMGKDVFDFLHYANKEPLVFPEYPINLVEKDRKISFLLGYCLNPDKYSEEYAKGYQKFAKLQRKKVLQEADKQGLTAVRAYYEYLDSLEEKKVSKQRQSKKKAASDKKSTSAKAQPRNTNESISMTEAKKTWRLKPLRFGEGYESSKCYRVDTISLDKYKGNEETVIIPSVIGNKPVSSIGVAAFQNNKTLKHIVIPESVIWIEDYAFDGCSALESVTIEGKTIRIGSRAFRYCSELSSFFCKSELEKMGIQPFEGCTQLMDNNGLIILTFQNQKVLCGCKMPIQSKEVIIPEGVERLDGYVFRCTDRSGYIDRTRIGKLRRIVLPNSVKSIASGTFNARNLQEVVLPDGLEELSAPFIFDDCSSLKELHLPSSITKLHPLFFSGGSEITLYSEAGGYVETFVNENKGIGYKFAVEGL